jgi:NET1-associated nuclear protein 1 (U3 small nucleolar RNA-associated protein 17)
MDEVFFALTYLRRHLIITYNTSIQVYSTIDSLLLRRIPVLAESVSHKESNQSATIVATRLSKRMRDHIWVACSNGRIVLINWSQPLENPVEFKTSSGTASAMALVLLGSGQTAEEAVVVAESKNRLLLRAYFFSPKSDLKTRNLLDIEKHEHGPGLKLLESNQDGSVLVGSLDERLVIGSAVNDAPDSFEKLKYEFFSFDTPDLITALDFRVGSRSKSPSSAKKDETPESKVQLDVVVGGARGAMYRYHDALSRVKATGNSHLAAAPLQALKSHWHRKAVHAVKWSRDGKSPGLLLNRRYQN